MCSAAYLVRNLQGIKGLVESFYHDVLCARRAELRQQQEQLRREQEKMRRSMELAEQRAREEASRREEYTKSLEAKFDKERQEYRRQVSLLHVQIASGYSNLTTGRIAAAHGRFNGIRQVAQVCTPPNTCLIGPPGFQIPNAISIGSAVFAQLTAYSQCLLHNGHPISVQNCPFGWEV